jgi:hypothetical protein
LEQLEEIDAVLDEILVQFKGFSFSRSPIELPNYHEKCPIN